MPLTVKEDDPPDEPFEVPLVKEGELPDEPKGGIIAWRKSHLTKDSQEDDLPKELFGGHTVKRTNLSVNRKEKIPFRKGPAFPLLVTLLVLISFQKAFAEPILQWIFPIGGQRGTTLQVEIHGRGLEKIAGVFFTGQGIRAKVLPPALDPQGKPRPENSEVRWLELSIGPSAPLGIQHLRVYDATGVSNPKFFYVGQWPETFEKEPNDDLETAHKITLPVTINGQISQNTDIDCFRFKAQKGQELALETYAQRLISNMGDSWLKGFLEVLNSRGKVLAFNEGRFHWDCALHFKAPEDGEYIVRFRDLQYRGSPSASYRLTLGQIPHSLAVYPAGGKRGTKVKVEFIGINLGAHPTTFIEIPEDTEEPFPIRLETPGGITNEVLFTPGDLPETLEAEPNNTPQQAQSVSPPLTINGRIQEAGDKDLYRFHGEKDQHLIFQVIAWNISSPLDSFITLYNSQGKPIAENDDAREKDSLLDIRLPEAGDYLLEIRDLDERGGPDFVYRLMITPPPADFKLFAAPDRLKLPSKGTASLEVRVQREWGFNGEVQVRVEGLPLGITATPSVIPEGQERTTITLTCTPSFDSPAPISFYAKVIGEATIGGRKVVHTARSQETYNIQGTAFTRELIGPIVVVGEVSSASLTTQVPHLERKGGENHSLFAIHSSCFRFAFLQPILLPPILVTHRFLSSYPNSLGAGTLPSSS